MKYLKTFNLFTNEDAQYINQSLEKYFDDIQNEMKKSCSEETINYILTEWRSQQSKIKKLVGQNFVTQVSVEETANQLLDEYKDVAEINLSGNDTMTNSVAPLNGETGDNNLD